MQIFKINLIFQIAKGAKVDCDEECEKKRKERLEEEEKLKAAKRTETTSVSTVS